MRMALGLVAALVFAHWLGFDVEPSTPAVPAGPGAVTVCSVKDRRLVELSGIVTTPSGFVVIDDSNNDAAAIRIFFLDRSCRVVRSIGYPTPARDPEDVAIADDGILWVADIGDNFTESTRDRRATIALWRL